MRRKPGVILPLEASILATAVELARRGVGEFHGFELAKTLRDGEGRRNLTAHGTLYKALTRMEKAGFLASVWEDPDSGDRRGAATAQAVLDHDRGAGRARPGRARIGGAGRGRPGVERIVNGAQPLAVKAVRRWAAVYTRGLPAEARERRCLELESDMWEHLHDPMRPMRPERFWAGFCVAFLPTCGGDIARSSNHEGPGKGAER